MLQISVCLPVRSDEKLLKQSLDALNGQVSEILVLDLGADQATLQVAKAFGAKILPLQWQNLMGEIWAAARQAAEQDWLGLVFPGEIPAASFWTDLEKCLAQTDLLEIEVTCRSPQDQRSESRIFKRTATEHDSQVYFPLFRESLNRRPGVGFAPGLALTAKETCWLRSPEVTGPLLDAAQTQANTPTGVKLLLGIRAFERQNDQQAKDIFEELQHLAARSADTGFTLLATRLYLLKTLWEMGKHQMAFEQLDRFRHTQATIEKQPALWVLRGVMARHVKETELAQECFQQALELSQSESLNLFNPLLQLPDISWKPWIGLGEIFLEEGLFTQAYHAFASARQTLPDHPYLAEQFVKAAFLNHNYPVLAPVLKQFPELPGFSAALHQALTALASANEGPFQANEMGPLADKLLAELKQDSLSALNSTSQPFLLSVVLEFALLLLQHQAPLIARPLLQHLTLRLPMQAMLWHNLAFSFFACKDYSQAETYYRQALMAQPDFVESRFDLGKVLVMQGKIEAACDEFEKILELQPQNQLAQRALAQLRGENIPVGLPTPAPIAAAEPEPETPFVFVFPLEANWENGIDIALKAYYEEFVAGDHVILALAQTQAGPEVERARAWAEQRFTADLLPPVVLLAQPLPLPPNQSCWLLPCRVPPAPALLAALAESPFPALVTGMPQSHLPTGFLPSHVHSDSTEISADAQARIWWEIESEVLKNQMRLAVEGFLHTEVGDSDPRDWNTHSLQAKATVAAELVTLAERVVPPNQDASALRVSVCLIVRNEAALLRRCLESVSADADEIIVVDTGSTDRTLEIARSFEKVKIFEKTWSDDFAEARNAALEQARCPWILMLDADEYLPAGFIASAKQYLAHHRKNVDAYVFSVVALDEDGVEVKADSLPVPRLFANDPLYRFRGRVHELLMHQDKPRMVYVHIQGLPIYHQGYQMQIRQDKNKLQRDTGLMERMIAESPQAPETERMYLILGQTQEKAENWDKALDYYRLGLSQIGEASPIHDTLQKGVWRVELRKGDPRPVYQAIEPHSCQDPEALLLWAEACQQMGLREEALRGYELALAVLERIANQPDIYSLRPARSQLLEKLAQAYEQAGQPTTALYFSERLVKENPSRAESWHSYRKLHQLAGLA